ncbi:LytTR family transcriptional regulator DNA-binding domain-containing protein [Gracilibacillus alcaliphilus]|uniref:LytTR family transcriptional regulator DNA-binding domain-containing protein n=1 Tax=Gracilibacillus alcaliphilus TaxID=1401441 RepID=UPI00195DB719|nr:LytTR family transcriptional regulator DNA-binding domain-containing protein [Gracilibacillus alcaliphilus]MBM7676965.1 ABC-2 type transport system ATP-binding protein [Gracilibacillus alcaliphilus]
MLKLAELEYHQGDYLLFPPFSFEVQAGERKAVQSTVNVRQLILKMITGELASFKGKVQVNNITLPMNKAEYFQAIAICLFDETFYERMTVREFLRFFQLLYQSAIDVPQVLEDIQLQEKESVKIQRLTYSEKRRLQFGKAVIQEADIFVFEEPDLNVDLETKRVLTQILDKLTKQQKAVLILTANMESAIILTDDVYRLDEHGLRSVKVNDEEDTANDSEMQETEEESEIIAPSFTLQKISAKVEDKIILFDPQEIDYIESHEGQAILYSQGVSFSTSFTLRELEDRLVYQGFFRCHRSYIVNLQKIREVITWTRNSYSLVLNDTAGTQVPLSKSKLPELKQILGVE